MDQEVEKGCDRVGSDETRFFARSTNLVDELGLEFE